jgi:hypothetical protein
VRTSLPLALVALACMTGTAAANGDPASDVLFTANAYLPYKTPSRPTAKALARAIEFVYTRHFRVKVAVIAGRVDLGDVPSLWGKPSEYALFLGTELSRFYVGPVLVVMPAGFGIYDGGRSVAAEKHVLASATIKGAHPDSLTLSAANAVGQLLRSGALRSRDIRAPWANPFPATVQPGEVAPLKFGVSDDSGWSKTVARVLAGSRVLTTLRTPLARVRPPNPVSLRWKVPRNVPPKGVRVCVAASDATGNRSAESCLAVTVKPATIRRRTEPFGQR